MRNLFQSRAVRMTAVVWVGACLTNPASVSGASTAAPQKSSTDIARAGGERSYWPDPVDPVRVMCATFLGGAGTEFLVGGGFQPDGTVVLVGNSLGPALGLAPNERVLGSDLPAPSEPKIDVVRDKSGKAKLDRAGKEIPGKPSWSHESATAFIVRCSPDMKRILSVSRLPWRSAAATSAWVGPGGEVYVAGRPGAGFASVWKTVEELPAGAEPARAVAECDRVFVLRLKADISGIEWIKTGPGPSCCPIVAAGPGGTVALTARQWYALDGSGKVVKTFHSPFGLGPKTAVSPVDGTVARGGCFMQGTGREPYKNPYLYIHEPDGKLRYELYHFDSHYVGMDFSRLVSDSEIRLVTFDRAGRLLFYAWSDGGNSVMTRSPTDMPQTVPLKGLGLNAAGAGANSFAYLIRLEPRDWQVTGWTFWCTRYGIGTPKPHANAIYVDTIALADNGAVCVAGDAAWGLVQTKDRICAPEAQPAGRYVSVFDGEMTRCRFCTALPGTGMAVLSGDDRTVFATGTVGGKARLLLLSSAGTEASVYGTVSPTPLVNPLQKTYGGGLCDGYAVLLDLDSTVPTPGIAAATTETSTTAARRMSYLDAVSVKPVALEALADGTKFYFSPAYPRFETVDAQFRDAAGRKWPSLLYGRPVSGTLEWSKGSLNGSLTVQCNGWNQIQGDQSRRVLGELVQGLSTGTPPALQMTLEQLGTVKVESIASTGKGKVSHVAVCDAKGTLELAGKKIAIAPRVTVQPGAPGRDGAVNSVRLTAWLTLKGKELGLKELADREIDVRISFCGADQPGVPERKPQPKQK